MKCSFTAEVFCLLTFTDDQWALIMDHFHQHYDLDLRIAAMVGGWLYGLNNHRILSDNKESQELKFTFRQIDSILKSLELDQSEQARDLDNKLRDVIHMLHAATMATIVVLKPLTIDHV